MFCRGENVVLQTAQCGGCDLRCEIGALALAESQIGLAILECHFKGPASGIYLPCLEEIQPSISCKHSVPLAVLGPANKEDSYRNTSEGGVEHDVAALELAAIFLQLEFLAEFYKRGRRKISMSGMVFCPAVLTDLYHAQPMAFYMTAMDKPDNILISEPTVRQYIAEPYATTDSPLYHLFGEFNLGHVIFPFSLTKYLAVVFCGTPTREFFFTHAIVAFVSLLSDDGEVEKNLRHSIGDSQTEALEPEYGLVGKMGMDTSDFFNRTACLLMIGVIENKADILGIMVGTQMYAVLQLYGYMPEGFPPVCHWILHKAVEDILACLDQRFESAVLLIEPGVSDAEAGKKRRHWNTASSLYAQLRLLITASVSRSIILTRTRMELMFCMAAVISDFLKKSLISERNGVILFIDMSELNVSHSLYVWLSFNRL